MAEYFGVEFSKNQFTYLWRELNVNGELSKAVSLINLANSKQLSPKINPLHQNGINIANNSTQIELKNGFLFIPDDAKTLAEMAYVDASLQMQEENLAIDKLLYCAKVQMCAVSIIEYKNNDIISLRWAHIIKLLFSLPEIEDIIKYIVNTANKLDSDQNLHIGIKEFVKFVKDISKVMGFYCPNSDLRQLLISYRDFDKHDLHNSCILEKEFDLQVYNRKMPIPSNAYNQIAVSANNTILLLKSNSSIRANRTDLNFNIIDNFYCHKVIEIEGKNCSEICLDHNQNEVWVHNFKKNEFNLYQTVEPFETLQILKFDFKINMISETYTMAATKSGVTLLVRKTIDQLASDNDKFVIYLQICSNGKGESFQTFTIPIPNDITSDFISNLKILNVVAADDVIPQSDESNLIYIAIIFNYGVSIGTIRIANQNQIKVTVQHMFIKLGKVDLKQNIRYCADKFGNLIVAIRKTGICIFKQPWNKVNCCHFIEDQNIYNIFDLACNEAQIYLLSNNEIKIYDYLPNFVHTNCNNGFLNVVDKFVN